MPLTPEQESSQQESLANLHSHFDDAQLSETQKEHKQVLLDAVDQYIKEKGIMFSEGENSIPAAELRDILWKQLILLDSHLQELDKKSLTQSLDQSLDQWNEKHYDTDEINKTVTAKEGIKGDIKAGKKSEKTWMTEADFHATGLITKPEDVKKGGTFLLPPVFISNVKEFDEKGQLEELVETVKKKIAETPQGDEETKVSIPYSDGTHWRALDLTMNKDGAVADAKIVDSLKSQEDSVHVKNIKSQLGWADFKGDVTCENKECQTNGHSCGDHVLQHFALEKQKAKRELSSAEAQIAAADDEVKLRAAVVAAIAAHEKTTTLTLAETGARKAENFELPKTYDVFEKMIKAVDPQATSQDQGTDKEGTTTWSAKLKNGAEVTETRKTNGDVMLKVAAKSPEQACEVLAQLIGAKTRLSLGLNPTDPLPAGSIKLNLACIQPPEFQALMQKEFEKQFGAAACDFGQSSRPDWAESKKVAPAPPAAAAADAKAPTNTGEEDGEVFEDAPDGSSRGPSPSLN